MLIRRAFMLLMIVLCTAGFIGTWSSGKPTLWEGWDAHDPQNTEDIDHAAWGTLLKTYVKNHPSGVNRFAYGKVTKADRAALNAYIGRLTGIEVTARSRDVQLAYWLNLYNALTVKVILDHYPVKTIRDIDISGLLSNGPWDKELVKIEGEDVSLNHIEHEILRPVWKDPRIHYGVNCASIGCPNLLPEPFTASNVNTLLDKAARDFVNHPRGMKIEDGEVTVSKIYSWFAHDFGNSEKGVIRHLLKYATPERAAQLQRIGRIADTQYDWSLNE